MDSELKRIKFEFETGRLNEINMSEYEKNKLIEFYKN